MAWNCRFTSSRSDQKTHISAGPSRGRRFCLSLGRAEAQRGFQAGHGRLGCCGLAPRRDGGQGTRNAPQAWRSLQRRRRVVRGPWSGLRFIRVPAIESPQSHRFASRQVYRLPSLRSDARRISRARPPGDEITCFIQSAQASGLSALQNLAGGLISFDRIPRSMGGPIPPGSRQTPRARSGRRGLAPPLSSAHGRWKQC